MVELSLQTPRYMQPIPVTLDNVPVNVPALLGLDVFDGYNLFADNVTNRLWHRVEICEDPSEVEDVCSILL